jgi:tetratricopeptide (TPR) repeat protein
MGARTGTKTPLAGQARVSQAAAASAPADDYFDRDKFNKAQDTYQQILGRNPTQAEINNLPKASDKNYSSIEDLERSLRAKKTLGPTTQAADDYFDRDKFNKVQDTYQQILGRNPTQAEINNLPKASDKNYSSIEDLKRSLLAKNPSQATISLLTDADRAASAAREVEKSRNTGVPLTQTPPGGVDDYYTPDNLRRDYEAANPGKNFERFLSSTEDQYGREAMAPVRSGLKSSPVSKTWLPKPAGLPAPSPSDFGRRVHARRAFGRREVSPFF